MREDIKNLLQLQELDLVKDDIEGRLKEIPELIQEEEDRSKEFQQDIWVDRI